MDAPFALAGVGAAQLALVGAIAFAASILGGLAGYGTGLVLPVFLAPVVGVANVIPVMAVGMAINNGSRVVAFGRDISWRHARWVLWFGLPACWAGAYGYTLLDARTVALAIGSFLVVSVPLRRALKRARIGLGRRGVMAAGGAFGFINGGMTGAGLLLIALLMAAGVEGAALIATDAIVSVIMGLFKIAIFGGLERLDAQLALAGLLIGACTAPGAFVARWLLARIPARVHTAFMEALVLAGGAGFLWRAWRA
jgi:uncharacterized membrane protein YfcA